ncbi:MAG TPA: sigma-70 family RNA polymerase sigma factor [Rhizomicrobium sp.]|nr:sigma-70 family RNA polymerase sigma factor [Rhizomicrobium sp.]
MGTVSQDELYMRAAAEFGPALARLAKAYEADASQRLDLLQDIHLALWRSFSSFAGQCSLRTWVYRVAHNVGISRRVRRRVAKLISLEELADLESAESPEDAAHAAHALERLQGLIRKLKPPDDQVMLLYLEDMDAVAIGEITGLSSRAVATRIHRVKLLLSRHFRQGETS